VQFENRAHHPTDIKDTDEYTCSAVDFTYPGVHPSDEMQLRG
jgi:hypothetical protein